MPIIDTIELANIELDRRVIVSDPCYKPDTWCTVHIEDMAPGAYAPFILISDEGKWGERVVELIVVPHDRTYDDLEFDELLGTAGVDSGMLGIWDLDQFATWSATPGWYSSFIEPIIDRRLRYLTFKECAAISDSGYGDGSYDVCASRDEMGSINGIRIRFL